MPILASLSRLQLGERLAGDGLYLRTGPFVTHIRSSIGTVADGLHLLYGQHAVLESCDFADFHVTVARGQGLRAWFRPQAHFRFDGMRPFQPLPLGQAFAMFEWGMNWCVSVNVNDYLIIHAAVVERDGCCAILPAPPGSGKSTLCAALSHRGWRLLSDELTMLRVSDGMVVPLPRPISLKNASIQVMRDFVPDAVMSPPVHDTLKGTVAHLMPPADAVARSEEAARAAWVVFPQYRAGNGAILTSVPQSRAFMRLADNAFNYSELGARGFETLARVADGIEAYDFTYSRLDDALDVFARLQPRNPA